MRCEGGGQKSDMFVMCGWMKDGVVSEDMRELHALFRYF